MHSRGQGTLPADQVAARISLSCVVILLALAAVVSVVFWRNDELGAGWMLCHVVRAWLMP
jgi:hypothetical protein